MADEPAEYLILSTKHIGHGGYALWWGPKQCGYYAELEAAGRYTSEEADRICSMLRGDAVTIHFRDAVALSGTVVEYGQRLRDLATTRCRCGDEQGDGDDD